MRHCLSVVDYDNCSIHTAPRILTCHLEYLEVYEGQQCRKFSHNMMNNVIMFDYLLPASSAWRTKHFQLIIFKELPWV